jgi:hypothetical protein
VELAVLIRRFVLGGALSALGATYAGGARAEEAPNFDGRDRYTLFDRHLQTRELRRQLEQPDQQFRMFRAWDRFSFAGDFSIGTQQVWDGGSQAHFHGFGIADTFAALAILPELSVNLNLLAFNPSASDGYRVSAGVKPGIAVDFGGELLHIAGKAVRFGVTGTDLGEITLGEGLLFEQTQLEGVIAWLSYGSTTLSYMYAGRSLWLDDDLIQSELSLFDRRLRFMFVQWQTDYTLAAGASPSFGNLVNTGAVARYVDATLDLPLPSGFHSGLEYALRVGASPSHAAIWRVDWLRRDLGPFQLHAGYQFRWYRHAFGPRDFELAPTVAFSFPYQEDAYVTNPYEYLGISHDFDQWSHTLMLEARVRLPRDFELFANEELWQRQASLFSRPSAIDSTPEGFQAPGDRLSGYYSAGVSYYPWHGSPQRADAYLTNKQVSGTNEASDTTFQRFKPGRYYVLRFKAFF